MVWLELQYSDAQLGWRTREARGLLDSQREALVFDGGTPFAASKLECGTPPLPATGVPLSDAARHYLPPQRK